jgi:hypothetical protein
LICMPEEISLSNCPFTKEVSCGRRRASCTVSIHVDRDLVGRR